MQNFKAFQSIWSGVDDGFSLSAFNSTAMLIDSSTVFGKVERYTNLYALPFDGAMIETVVR